MAGARRGRGRGHRREPAAHAPADPVPSARASRRAIAAILAVFAVVFVALQVVSYTQKSATWDEPIHLTAGYVALTRGDQRVDPTHPPFLRMWAALPLTVMSGVSADASAIDRSPVAQWLGRDAYTFAHDFLYVQNDADRLLYAARFMVVLLGVALGVLLFSWVYEWLGFWPAAFALLMYAISPSIAAHASLVTTDLGVSCFMFGAIYFLWRTSRRVSAGNLAGLSVFVALAVVSKFSGLALAPIIVVLLAVAVLTRSAISLKTAAGIALLLVATTFLAIWAVYGFRYLPSSSPAWLVSWGKGVDVAGASVITSVARWFDAHHVLPNAFIEGFLYSIGSAQRVGGFLAGEVSTEGWWYYLPFAFVLKTPLSFLVLLAAGLAVGVLQWRRLGSTNEAFVLVPVAVFLGLSMDSSVSLGVRHILPVYAFFLMVVALAARELAERGLPARLALAALTGFAAVQFGAVYPNTLTFFNPLAGGPDGGRRYLVDSNLDWGQHLKALKEWMNGNGVRHINLAYFGSADPGYYGIDCTYLPGSPTFALTSLMRPVLPGYVAVSATVLSGVYLQPQWRLFYSALDDLEPVADIGHTIRVYWLNTWPEVRADAAKPPADLDSERILADALLFGFGWSDHAVVHYRRYLARRPNESATLASLALAQVQSGQPDDAVLTLRRAVRANPADARAHRLLASALLRAETAAEAERHARAAVDLARTDPVAHDILGRTLAVQGRLGAAEAEFRRALELDPSNADARTDLGYVSSGGQRR